MLPLKLCRVAGIKTICNITFKELKQLPVRLPAHRLAITSFYCTQIKKNDIALGTVKNTELLQVNISLYSRF